LFPIQKIKELGESIEAFLIGTVAALVTTVQKLECNLHYRLQTEDLKMIRHW